MHPCNHANIQPCINAPVPHHFTNPSSQWPMTVLSSSFPMTVLLSSFPLRQWFYWNIRKCHSMAALMPTYFLCRHIKDPGLKIACNDYNSLIKNYQAKNYIINNLFFDNQKTGGWHHIDRFYHLFLDFKVSTFRGYMV